MSGGGFAWYHNSGKVNNSVFVTMKRRPRCPDILGFNINNPSYRTPAPFPHNQIGTPNGLYLSIYFAKDHIYNITSIFIQGDITSCIYSGYSVFMVPCYMTTTI
jgi:hypothetical protein